MKIREWYCLKRYDIKNGDDMWACAYQVTYNKDGIRYVQKPVKGKLVSSKYQSTYEEDIQKGLTDLKYIKFFVPYKKNGIDLAWSKAVGIESRQYATTEEESREIYNEEIESYINMHKRMIEELENDRLA